MQLKVTESKALHSLPKVYFFKYILRAKAWIFFGMKLPIFHSIYIRKRLGKFVRKTTR